MYRSKRYTKKLDARKSQTLASIDIRSKSFYTQELAEQAERAICEAVYNQDSPLARCLGREVSFDLVPFATRGTDGRVHISGEATPVLRTVIACHPNSVIKGTVVEAVCEPCDLLGFFQDAFLAYLAAFRTCSMVQYRLRSDKRFKALVDPETGICYDRDKDKDIPEGTILLLNL